MENMCECGRRNSIDAEECGVLGLGLVVQIGRLAGKTMHCAGGMQMETNQYGTLIAAHSTRALHTYMAKTKKHIQYITS